MATDLHIPLLTATYTKSQSAHRLGILKELINSWLFDNKNDSDLPQILEDYLKTSKIIKKDDPEWLREMIPLIKAQIDPTKNLAKQSVELIETLEKALSTTKLVSIYLPFNYDDEILKQFGEWLKKELGKDCLMEPSLEPNLIGGCALSYNGIYHDYSLAGKISVNRSQILKQLLSFKKE